MLDYEIGMENEEIKKSFIHDFKKYLYNVNNKNEIIFLCVGTDKVIGDCIGPIIGTQIENKLKKLNISNINVYGTLKNNLNYKNINEVLINISHSYKKPLIIVIDSALSNKENIGKIFVSNNKTIIGNGLNKNNIVIGDISIKVAITKNYKLPSYNFKALQNISLNTVMILSNIVSEGIIETIKYS